MTDEQEPAPEQQPVPLVPRKIAMIGKAPDSLGLAPYGDPECEVWILNTLGHLKEVPRWDRQFELHDLELTKDKAYGDYYEWLTKQGSPVFLRDAPPPEFKHGIQFPLGEILDRYAGLSGRTYLTNTVSLMVALAIFEHDSGLTVGEIGLYGINMAQHGLAGGGGNSGWFTSEYARQRPSVEYWLGFAEGKGIKVTIPDPSDLLKCSAIYGYHTTDVLKKVTAREKELQQRISQAQAREQQAHDEAVFLSGAVEGLQYDKQWMPGGAIAWPTKPSK